jgi:hypothetical protein
MSVAQTILSQIKTLDRTAMIAWGAKDLVNMNDGLKFKTSGMTKWKGYVYVKYNEGSDLYDIDFFRIRGVDVKYDKQAKGIYAEDLVWVIDGVVG